MRVFPVMLMLLVLSCAGIAVAQEEGEAQPESQVLLDSTNTAPPPPTDEYINVPPGLLMTDNSVSPQRMANPGDEQDVMTMDEVVAAYNRGKYPLVAKHLAPIAASGYPQAEELLGIMYYKGQGVQQDDETAVSWLTKAADADRPLAQHYLATLTYAGKGTQQDSVTALMWLYIAVVHYPEGTEKDRAVQDRSSLAARLSRRDRARAFELAHDWLKKKDEAALLDQEPTP